MWAAYFILLGYKIVKSPTPQASKARRNDARDPIAPAPDSGTRRPGGIAHRQANGQVVSNRHRSGAPSKFL